MSKIYEKQKNKPLKHGVAATSCVCNPMFASHNKEDIDILCDEVYEMEDGYLRSMQ